MKIISDVFQYLYGKKYLTLVILKKYENGNVSKMRSNINNNLTGPVKFQNKNQAPNHIFV